MKPYLLPHCLHVNFLLQFLVWMLQCSWGALNLIVVVCKLHLCVPLFYLQSNTWDKNGPIYPFIISQLPLSLWWSLLLVLQKWVRATPSAALSVEQILSAPPPPPTAGTMRAVIPGHKLGPPAPTPSILCNHTILGGIHVRWTLPPPTWVVTSVGVGRRISLYWVSVTGIIL